MQEAVYLSIDHDYQLKLSSTAYFTKLMQISLPQ